jgi:hypothetical protein
MKQDVKNEIIRKLNEKGASKPCARCGHEHFSLLDDYSKISLQPEIDGFVLGGAAIPVFNIACTNCGAITQHALGALGLLNNNIGVGENDK